MRDNWERGGGEGLHCWRGLTEREAPFTLPVKSGNLVSMNREWGGHNNAVTH